MTGFQARLLMALKEIRLSTTSHIVAERVGENTRAVASGLRGLIVTGCVSVSMKKGVAYYRYVRRTPKLQEERHVG